VTRQSPRRPASSRTPVSRPRRVAGQGTAPEETLVEPVETPAAEATQPEAPAEPPLVEPVEPPAAEAPEDAPQISTSSISDGADERAGLAALFDSRRATTILVSLVAVLALVAGGLFAWDAARGDDEAKPSKQPVVLGGDDATAGVEAAAKSAETIVATSYADYDKQVDEATALMTDAFAKEYRQTAEDIKDQFVQAKTQLEARVVAQGVVHATRTEVQALVFLNEYVSKDGGDTTYTPYRALVTVVHTDRGWLVSAIDTK
jgi:Mce-associated membrane protein